MKRLKQIAMLGLLASALDLARAAPRFGAVRQQEYWEPEPVTKFNQNGRGINWTMT
ncbi:MAG: hypothetical protein ACXWXZ_16330 [Candidatus Binatia bacterium]